MAYNYIDTPRTEAPDITAANISFSEVQRYPSPSKDRNSLMGQLRPKAAGYGTSTPRSRNAAAGLHAAKKAEFTPLLKSAAHNRFKNASNTPNKSSRGKENEKDDLVNSMLAASTREAPQTPAYLRTGYRQSQRTPALPVDSSVLDASRSSLTGIRTPGPPPPISSSILSGTPLAEMPKRGEQGRTDQGNILTLREQEAKLEKLDKENFNLKLKIHFLDEALKRSGTDYQQGMIKENTELKIDRTTMTHEIKQQRKALARAEKELEEYRQQLRDFADKVKRRHTDEVMKEEMDRLRTLAEKGQQLADAREEEIDELRRRLDLADQGSSGKAQDLRDDIADLEQELRAKEAEIDARDEEIEALEAKLRSSSNQDDEVAELQQDLEQVEAKLEERNGELARRDQELGELRSQMRSSQDREKSTKKLRGDVDLLEAEIREKNEVIDEKHEELRSMQKRLQIAESKVSSTAHEQSAELRDKDRMLEDKDGEIKALEERLKTARGSWDAEAQQSDARLHEKDKAIQDRDAQLREKARLIDEKDDVISYLRKNLEAKEFETKDVAAQQERQTVQKNLQISELQDKLRTANSELDFHIDKQNAELSKLRKELDAAAEGSEKLQERLDARGSPTKKDAVINEQAARLRELESKLERTVDEKDAEIEELEGQLSAAETELEAQRRRFNEAPTGGYEGEKVSSLSRQLEAALQSKQALADEVAVLETSLDAVQDSKTVLERTIGDLRIELRTIQAKSQDSTPVRERNELRLRIRVVEKQCEDYQAQVDLLEKELDRVLVNKPTAAPPGVEVKDLGERRDLHNMLKDAQIEIESLQDRLRDQDKDTVTSRKRDADARVQLQQMRRERDEGIVELSERDARIASLLSREKDLRSQVQRLRDAMAHTEDLEGQLEDKRDSSSNHARREAELRNNLRTAKADLEELRSELRERNDQLSASKQKEQQLRDRIRKARQATDGSSLFEQDLNAQLSEAEMELQTLQAELQDRERKLQTSLRRETELRAKMKSLRANQKISNDDQSRRQPSEAQGKMYEKQMRGLTKQIQYLNAKCSREQSFRKDLAFIKRWFMLQVEMYGACNKADLKLLEEIGITPTLEARESRPSMKAAGHAVIATIRMRKMSQAWAGSRKLHMSLLKKLESMKTQELTAW